MVKHIHRLWNTIYTWTYSSTAVIFSQIQINCSLNIKILCNTEQRWKTKLWNWHMFAASPLGLNGFLLQWLVVTEAHFCFTLCENKWFWVLSYCWDICISPPALRLREHGRRSGQRSVRAIRWGVSNLENAVLLKWHECHLHELTVSCNYLHKTCTSATQLKIT